MGFICLLNKIHRRRILPAAVRRGVGCRGARRQRQLTKPAPEFNGEQLSFFHAIEQFGILKSFQHDLYLLTGLPFDFVDLRMRSSDKLQAHRLFTSFCTLVNSTHLGRLACERDDQKAASTCLKGSGCLARRCHLGLIDITTPIVINGRAVGLLCTGQLLYNRPTQQAFQRIQKRLASLGVDVAKARQAYFKLPVLEKQRVTAIIDLMQMVAELIGNQRLQTLKTVVLHHPLSKALDFMEAHYAEPLTLPLVAKAAGLSVSRLAHVFKAQVGMSVTAYLNMVRVNWARVLSDELQSEGQRNGLPSGVRQSEPLQSRFPAGNRSLPDAIPPTAHQHKKVVFRQ